MEGRKFYKDSDAIYRIDIEYDYLPDSPRKVNDNIGHMMCWHKGYDLGDTNPFKDPDECLNEMIQQEYKDEGIIRYIKKHPASNDIKIKYDRKEKEYKLIANYRVWWNGGTIHRGEVDSQPDVTWLIDSILDALPIYDKIVMLQKKGYVFLPLSVYEHSGITMYVGSPSDHFDGQWDCSAVGFIYAQKEEILENLGCYMDEAGKRHNVNKNNWKKAAEYICKSEAKTYDMYLTGEIYGYSIDKLDEDYVLQNNVPIKEAEIHEDCWERVESQWGIYSENYGEKLVEEITKEAGISPYFDTLKEVM